MSNSKALIFDLGKVVFDLSFDRVFASWAGASGRSLEEIRERFRYDDYFDLFEKAAIEPPVFRQHVQQLLKIELTDEQFDDGWCDLYLDVFPRVEELLIELNKRYRLVALTNTNEIHAPVWQKKYATVLKQFEKVFSSHELRCRKPEAAAYLEVLRYLDYQPEDCLFLDDNASNIEGARNVGVPTIHVLSPAQMFLSLSDATGVAL